MTASNPSRSADAKRSGYNGPRVNASFVPNAYTLAPSPFSSALGRYPISSSVAGEQYSRHLIRRAVSAPPMYRSQGPLSKSRIRIKPPPVYGSISDALIRFFWFIDDP
jgi:hypothetical protein